MRIARLDLLRYGKFTDRCVSMPRAGRDFHFIVGPNEAGKSTLRDAIQDLLFGIETRSRYNFLHPHSDMRVGAWIERDGGALDFVRIKARSNTLKAADGASLPDAALIPFLGPIDRSFFDQMFGLNHQRLVDGGEQILSAANDIGRILFQAAAGINRLGEICERLEQEANQLWGRRKSGEREYYRASDEYERARADLEHAVVRTRDWLEARKRVEDLRAALDQARTRRSELERERHRLERVRRIAPTLAALHGQESQLGELGEVTILPEHAGQQLARAEQDVALTTHALQLHETRIAELRTQRDALDPDQALLDRAREIDALTTVRQQLRNHQRDIGRREEEVRVLAQAVQDAARQLGWPDAAEAALAQRLPGRLARSAIADLLNRHEALSQALARDEEAILSRENELANLEAELAGLPRENLPDGLLDAQAAARALGDVPVHRQRLESQVVRLTRALENAVLELGPWQRELDELKKLALPSREEIAELVQRRRTLETSASQRTEKIAETRAELAALRLEITQYQAVHQPVTRAQVQLQRNGRDLTWRAIKTGAVALQEAADGYERQVAEADALSDQRHDKAKEETELQSRQDGLQRLQQQLTDLESRLANDQAALAALDQAWNGRMMVLRLPGLPLLRIESWRTAREQVLQTAETLNEARTACDEFLDSVVAATAALAEALQPITPEIQCLALPALLRLADQTVEAASGAREQRKALMAQQARAGAALSTARNRWEEGCRNNAAWCSELHRNLVLAHLPPDATVGMLRAALELFDDMSKDLDKIRGLRVDRIDPMRHDLEDFAAAAEALALNAAPAIAGEPAEQISVELESRLKQASDQARERDRLTSELATTAAAADAARNGVAAAHASLRPLRQCLPDGADHDRLREAIQKSDRHRQLTAQRDQTLQKLLQDGDGLDRVVLETDVSGADAPSIPIRLSDIGNEIDRLVNQQNQWSSELSIAEAALSRIAGQDEAARAESRRQEALARMSNAVERYVRVRTAARLLRWAIERFREYKQGPMLARASDIFCGLTAGSLPRLCVDHERNPPALFGLRPNGTAIGIEGMSEGTRDQLYLALRLAALELHLEQTEPLPFIADDLFINYDDGRARAGFEALATLAELTQVIFLSHHHHLLPVARTVFGDGMNVVDLLE